MDMKEKEKYNDLYTVRSNVLQDLDSCSSGGFFPVLARYIIENGGIVFAAAYNEKMCVVHRKISDISEIKNFCGSKYLQSDLQNCFQEIHNLLCQKYQVCFVGTPCQVAGLKKFLQKDFTNLITVDFACHGVPSPLLWKQYMAYQEEKFHSRIARANFRKKKFGYHSSTMELVFKNGKIYNGSARTDLFLKCFFNEIVSRPSCYHCQFKTIFRVSDFTVFDCWHFSQLTGKKDDDCGYTNLLIQSDKGHNIFLELNKRLHYQKVELEQAVNCDGEMMSRSVKAHPRREIFFHDLAENGIKAAVENSIPVTRKDYIVETIKKIVLSCKILRKIRNKLKRHG